MFPSILDGDRVTVYGEPEDWKKGLIYLISHEPKLDDKVQHKSLVKRLIGFAGDTIEVKDGRVTRNGDKFTYENLRATTGGGVTIIPNEIWHFYYEIDNFGNKYIVRLPNEEQKTSDLKA